MGTLGSVKLWFTLLSKTFRTLASVTVEHVDDVTLDLIGLSDAAGGLCRMG
jgi:hypothetical protein